VPQAILQRQVDSSIAKTVNLPETISFDDFSRLYEQAYQLGIKGFTMFRPNPITRRVLVTEPALNNDELCGVFDRQSCSVPLRAD
jgi:ribonucleoside-diphosphate reductase alpha chain